MGSMPGPSMKHDMGDVDNAAASPSKAPPPSGAFSGPRHAADTIFDPSVMAGAREDLRVEQGGMLHSFFLVDRLEARSKDGYPWDMQGWYGGDINKLWLKTEGEGRFGRSPVDAELQALYSRAISPWFNFQTGLRHDVRPTPERTHFVVGIQGLLPYTFELDAAAFLSNKGDLTARVEFEYDQLITQRLILQPRVEVNLAGQDIPELKIGSGFSSMEAGLRLRYEFRREFAPYVGVGWGRKLGATADFARAAGESPGGWNFVLGARTWF
jgi:copper resistance protein B